MVFTSLRKNTYSTSTQEAISEELIKQFDEKAGLRLRFPDETLEAEFQEFYSKRYRNHVHIGFYLILLFFLCMGISDFFCAPAIYNILLKVRLLIALPLFFIYWFMSSKEIIKFQQLIVLTFISIVSVGMIITAFMTDSPYNYYNNYAIAFIPIFTFILTRLLFNLTFLFILLLSFVYVFLCLIIRPFPSSMVSLHFFFLLFSSAFSLTSAFLLERVLRKVYLQSRILSFQKQDLQEANVRLKYLIALDGLTGIANRRTLDETLAAEWQRALRNGNPISLLMLDIDHFKQFNDTYGHQAGDSCLKEVSRTLKAFARRPGDLAARYGGEEFAIVLSNTELIEASIVATRVLQAVQALGISHAKSSVSNTVTLSIGIAVMIPDPSCKPSQLVANADKALYCAKAQGRNRVAVL